MKKDMMYLKHGMIGLLLVCVFALAACGGTTTSSSNTVTPNATATQPEVSTNPTKSVAATTTTATTTTRKANTPVVATPVTTPTPSNGPQTILTPTPVVGGGANSQQVVLADRTLIISSESKQNSGTNSTAVTLVMAVHNTGTKAIQNQASFYELVGTEGDIFGLQSSATASFFGTIDSQSSLNGTIVFQVPSAASNGLRLLFRPEVASETVFVALK